MEDEAVRRMRRCFVFGEPFQLGHRAGWFVVVANRGLQDCPGLVSEVRCERIQLGLLITLLTYLLALLARVTDLAVTEYTTRLALVQGHLGER